MTKHNESKGERHEDENTHRQEELRAHGEDAHRETMDTASRILIAEARKTFTPEVAERLVRDLGMDHTASYSRINFTEVFIAFNFYAHNTLTHWRIAKILDGLVYCTDELGIIAKEDGISPSGIEEKIYKRLTENKADEKFLKIKLENPDDPSENIPEIKASLVDIAHFMDVLKMNREMGPEGRFSIKEIIYQYFTKKELKKEITIDESGVAKKKTIDLFDAAVNPIDTYQEVDMPGYLRSIELCQSGLQMVGNWRFESPQHREMAAQAFKVKLNGISQWIPLSGEMAQRITFEDMQKVVGSNNHSLDGQPQEVGDMDEKSPGAVIRFRRRFLKQRLSANNVNVLGSQTSPRMAKAMVGLTLLETPRPVMEEDSRGNKVKTVYLCGQNVDGNIIDSMKNHYDTVRHSLGLPPLNKYEAADLAFTDVFAPCILNNEIDWLLAFNKAYGLQLQPNVLAAAAKLKGTNGANFGGNFVIKLYLRDFVTGNGELKQVTISSVDELRAHVQARLARGHIEPDAQDLAGGGTKMEEATDMKPAFELSDEFTDELAKQYKGVLEEILQPGYEHYLKEFARGKSMFKSMYVGDERVPANEERDGQTLLTFDAIIRIALEKYPDQEGLSNRLADIFPDLNDTLDENAEEMLTDAAKDTFVRQLRALDKTDRLKFLNRER